MDAENFFARWSKHKAEADAPDAIAGAAAYDQPEQSLPPPTIEDVASLTPQSDYTRFVARGVDENIKRSALKKLFSDPYFNVMDGLDTYIGDYNKFEPIPPEMLALLGHAKGLLDPLSQFEQPLMRLLQSADSPEQEPADEPPATVENVTDPASASTEPPSPVAETDLSAPDDATPIQPIARPDDEHQI